jgi:nanoRNase/pAp phosphatase (c-di-AMP/oligoRNAs hydrolase)
MRLRVLYHGNCFDGCSAAGVFTRFYRERIAKGPVEVLYRPLEHKGDAQPFASDWFDGDENACVDFRYSQDPRLTWWFDHHASAFQLPGDEDHFRADATGRKFYDPKAKSCTKFLADTVAVKFGFDPAPIAELIAWAETIDGALFTDAKMAVELKEPALRLMTFIENNRDPALAERFIADLVSRPLDAIVAEDYVARPLGALLAQHQRNIETMRAAARLEGGVVFFDLADRETGAFNKFISYYLFPEARYSVGVSLASRAKISIGANPWATTLRTHEINRICERYGGGGHPVVGAISLPRGELARAREIARAVVEELET